MQVVFALSVGARKIGSDPASAIAKMQPMIQRGPLANTQRASQLLPI